jgi:hypothetical protein
VHLQKKVSVTYLPGKTDWRLTRQVVVVFVLPIQHRRRYVRNVSASVTFASDVDLELFDAEGFLKVCEKAEKVLRDFFFSRCCDISVRETSTNRLLDPE